MSTVRTILAIIGAWFVLGMVVSTGLIALRSLARRRALRRGPIDGRPFADLDGDLHP